MVKSYKREVAGGLLLLWAVLVVKVFFFAGPDMVEPLGGILAGLTVWMVPPAMTVFCFHSYINKDKP